MPLTSGQFLPIVSVKVYDESQQDPLVRDHGYSLVDFVANGGLYGTFEADSAGRLKLEWLEDIGLLNRPTLNLQDTALTHFATVGGTWEARIPSTGSPRKTRIWQLDSTAALQWSATSNYTVPAIVDFAFSIGLPDTPPDWDSTTYPPYVQFEWASVWAIGLTKQGAALLRKVGGVWGAVMELKRPARGIGYSDGEEFFFYVRTTRGRIGISSDFGETYEWYQQPSGADLFTVAAPIAIRGQGGMASFGFHQLAYATGYYECAEDDTFTQRPLAAPTIVAAGHLRTGVSVATSDQSTDSRRYAKYRVTLTPGTAPATPFIFYRCPSVQRVWLRWAPDVLARSGTYTTPWDTRIKGISIVKSRRLSEGRATITLELDRGSAWPGAVGSLRDRKVQISGGYRRGGTDHLTVLFTGYIVDWETSGEGGRFRVDIHLQNATHTFRSTHWTQQDLAPLGGQSLNSALDYVLASEGLNASYRAWHVVGDLFILPAGLYEDPFELIRPQECKWETLERLAGYAGLEIGALDDATFATVPLDTTSGTSHTYGCLPEDGDLWAIARQLSGRVDYERSVTAIMVTGRAANGAKLTAWARDSFAENSLLSGRFAPRRHVIEETIPGTCTPGIVLARAQTLALQHFPVRNEPDLVVELNPNIGRRDEIVVNGGAISGVADGTAFVVMELRHEIACNDDGSGVMVTAGGLWELA